MVDILAFGAHPDDLEFSCGGILTKMASQGKSIVMVDLTLGDKATNGTPEIRRRESLESAKVIGAERVFMDFKDCEIIDSYESRLKFVEIIRTYKPRLILAPLWEGGFNHPDHLACGVMVRAAFRYSRFANILPHLPKFVPGGIMHYLGSEPKKPDILIDVSENVEQWKKMMSCHKTQHQTFNYSDWVLRGASAYGVMADCAYAQGLIQGTPIIVNDLLEIAHGTREI